MIFKYQSKNKITLFIVLFIVLVIGFWVYMYLPVILQEGNPWPEIKGMVQLKFNGKDIIQLSGSDNKFMTESKNGTMIHDFMKTRGYEFTGQMGSGYFFESRAGQKAIATHKYYSRHYSLWTITENDNDLWMTTTDAQGVIFQYPKKLLAKYVSAVEWPPVIKIETGTYSCQTTPLEISSMSDIILERLVDNRTYCVNIKNEGAAGSVYSSYIYTIAKNDKLINISFILQYPNCNNYDEEQKKDCTNERETFDIDSIIDRIAQSIIIK